MASLSKDNQTIQFVAPDGARKTLRLGRLMGSSKNGKVTAKAGASIKLKVEELLAAATTGTPLAADLAKWVGGIKVNQTKLYDKLAAVGLLPEREQIARKSLGTFLADYIAGRTDVKPGTMSVFRSVERGLLAHFGAEKPLPAITAEDAEGWRRWLATSEKLGENTIRRRCGIARQFFHAAVRAKQIEENPFAEMKGLSVKSNRSRDYFVTREEADKVLAACPDAEWRLLFALCRYGGLRCPSEVLTLRWSDIHWDANRITVHSPKTEHHEGGESRVMPLFPELRPYFDAVWDEAQERDEAVEFVITRYRQPNANLRTQLERIIKRAGLTAWPKLFMNLRATRATELVAKYPGHVVSKWLGHSPTIAEKHYWQTTDADFENAATLPTGAMPKALHEPVQSPAVSGRHTSSRGDGKKVDATENADRTQLSSISVASIHSPGGTRTPDQGIMSPLL